MASALPQPELDFEAMSAEEVLRWAYAEFGDRLCLTCSWQKQSSALVHMVSELGLDIDVIELDTHLFFRESYETREALVRRYGLKLLRPDIITVAQQHREEGPNLWERDPDRCCHIRKVEPLERSLAPYDAWISGIRREQALTRKDAKRVGLSDCVPRWSHTASLIGSRVSLAGRLPSAWRRSSKTWPSPRVGRRPSTSGTGTPARWAG